MFAELPDPNLASSIGWVCVILVTIIVGLRQGMGFVRDMKDKPSPGDVSRESAERFNTKHEFHQHVAANNRDHENLFSKIGGVERGLKTAIEQQIDTVRKDLIGCVRDIAGLNKETQLQNQSLARVESKLDRLIERT